MKPLYIKKDGIVQKVSGIGMPATYPAENTSYDNTDSGLTADDVQDAIDEIVDIIGDLPNNDTWRNIKVNGTEKLGTAKTTGAVDFVNGTNTAVSFDANGNKIKVDATNTTYTFQGGTNSFSVTPSGGTAQTVNVTPSIADATTSTSGLMSPTDKTKLNGIASGAEVNQNAFSNVKVGSTTIESGSKTDTIEFVAGSNVSITPDTTNKKVTIAATDTNTTYTIAQGDSNGQIKVTPSSGDAYNVNVKGLGSAAYKNITDTYSASGTDAVSGKAIAEALNTLPEPMVFKGTLGTGGTITTLPVDGSATIGDTYKVITAGTYDSKAAKVGDTFICKTKTSSANTWELIPSGDEPSGTVTNVATGVGLTGGPITSSGTIKANLRSETALTNDSQAATEVAGKVYPVAQDKSGYLAVNIPWSDTNNRKSFYGTCSTAAATAAKEVTLADTTGWELKAGTIVGVKFSNTNSASNCTLNVNGSGAKSIWYNNAAYTSNSTNICGTSGRMTYYMYDGTTYWIWMGASWVIDTNTYDRNLYNATIKCGSTAIVANNIIVGKDGVYHHLKDGTAFDITYAILRASADIPANGTGSNNYDVIPFNITYTQNMTLTAYLPVYIKGTLSGNTFTPISTTPLTQTIPSTADGYHYMLLGIAYNTTNVYLQERHPIYAYKNGAFGEVVNDAMSVNGYTVAKSVPSNAVFTDRYVNSASFADNSSNNTNEPVKMTLTRAGSDTVAITGNIPKVSSSSAGVVPKGAAVSSQSQSTKFLREDGTWAAPSYTTNSDTKVTQTATSTNANYEVLFSATADNTTRTEGARKNSNLTFNPNTGLLSNDFYGSSISINSRLTDFNFAASSSRAGCTKVRFDLMTSSATTGKVPVSPAGYVHTYYWDAASAMTQIYIPNGDHTPGGANGPQGLMIRGYDNDSTWKDWTYIPFMTTTPTSGQVVITDGTTGGVKSSGYTVAKSVPSNAVFTDANVTQTATSTNAAYEVLFSSTADNTTRTEGARKNSNLIFNPSTGLLTASNAQAVLIGVNSNTGTTGGISLYNGTGNSDNYGIMFRKLSNKGTHGYMQNTNNWATYFTMFLDGTSERGWIFNNKNVGNVASIDTNGRAVFNGSVTIGGNEANTTGARMEFNSTTKAIDFVFVQKYLS